MTNRNRVNGPQTSLSPAMRSLQGLTSPAGSRWGRHHTITLMVRMYMSSAKMQKATLDPSKVSGRCGRLKCCLRYELPNAAGQVHGGCGSEGSCDNPSGCGTGSCGSGGCASGTCGCH